MSVAEVLAGQRAWSIAQGDARAVLASLPAESVQCVVTSPPYWGLRDYGVEGQLGLEPTLDEYLGHMVGVFREVRRVLRVDGTCWVNMGDSYVASPNGGHGKETSTLTKPRGGSTRASHLANPAGLTKGRRFGDLKPKDLVGQPWRLAFALQADGWWLRSDIIWDKPNPMPESIRDRPTKSHEYVFLLAKQPRYFYDHEAIKETLGKSTQAAISRGVRERPESGYKHDADTRMGKASGNRAFSDPESLARIASGRNKRSVWRIATKPFDGAHCAVFPEGLVEPCVKAGSSEKGACIACGAPWERIVEEVREPDERAGENAFRGKGAERVSPGGPDNRDGYEPQVITAVIQKGWKASCECGGAVTWPCLVLDPFAGSGTTGLAALGLGRRFLGIELNPEYVAIAERRLGAWRGQQQLTPAGLRRWGVEHDGQ